MKFQERTITLKDSRTYILRPNHPNDAADMIEYLKITAAETPSNIWGFYDFLLK